MRLMSNKEVEEAGRIFLKTLLKESNSISQSNWELIANIVAETIEDNPNYGHSKPIKKKSK